MYNIPFIKWISIDIALYVKKTLTLYMDVTSVTDISLVNG